MSKAETLAAFQASRHAVGKREDPAAWLLERQRGELERKLQRFRQAKYGPAWFEDWYATRKAKNVHVPTLIAYLRDLEFFGPDPATLTTSQIIRRLSELSTKTKSAERYRRLCVTIKTIVKQLHGRDEADKIPTPPHGKARVIVLSPAEIKKMLEACDNPRDRLIIEFFTKLGDRRADPLYLRR
jgi:integrase